MKSDYKKFVTYTANARRSAWNGWMPNTLVDDTRQIILRGYGPQTWKEVIESAMEWQLTLDKYRTQKTIVQIWFEAEAMFSQFDYLTAAYEVTLVPFRGDPSLDHRFNVARVIKGLESSYRGKEIVVLYFGDYDKKGLQIPETAERWIRAATETPFKYFRCGLNEEHAVKYNLPDNPEKPGQYQWEALPEEAAAEIVLGNLKKYIDLEAIRKVQKREKRYRQRWRKLLENFK